MKVSYYKSEQLPCCFENKDSHNGYYSTLEHIELRDLLEYQSSIDPSTLTNKENKHKFGGLYCFVDERKVYHSTEDMKNNNVTTDGVQFIDIDHLSKDEADTIFRDFELYCEKIPCLLAIQYSFSHNLHVFIKTKPLSQSEFNKNLAVMYTIFIKVVQMVSGINIDRKGICDSAMFKFGQRFFLCSSPYKWNELAAVVAYPEPDIKQINPMFRQYFFTPKNEYVNNDVSYKGQSSLDVSPVEYIPHQDRMKLYSSLCYLFLNKDLENEWVKCCKRIPTTQHSLEFYLNEPHRNHWKRCGMSERLLKMFGYTWHEIDQHQDTQHQYISPTHKSLINW